MFLPFNYISNMSCVFLFFIAVAIANPIANPQDPIDWNSISDNVLGDSNNVEQPNIQANSIDNECSPDALTSDDDNEGDILRRELPGYCRVRIMIP